MTKDEIFLNIAQKYLGIETLETRKRDRLDFHDVTLWSVKAALEAAYTAGHLTAAKVYTKTVRRGSSFMAAFQATYNDIAEVFGEPGKGDGCKIEAEWRIRISGQSVQIYNYKNSKCYSSTYPDIKSVTEWHIVGNDCALVDKVIAMMAGKAKLIRRQGE
jgi:hypothetical protein